jgi:hypothetical protein
VQVYLIQHKNLYQDKQHEPDNIFYKCAHLIFVFTCGEIFVATEARNHRNLIIDISPKATSVFFRASVPLWQSIFAEGEHFFFISPAVKFYCHGGHGITEIRLLTQAQKLFCIFLCFMPLWQIHFCRRQ